MSHHVHVVWNAAGTAKHWHARPPFASMQLRTDSSPDRYGGRPAVVEEYTAEGGTRTAVTLFASAWQMTQTFDTSQP